MVERARIAPQVLTDVGQYGVYCTSNQNPAVPTLDLQFVLSQITGAKELIQSVMQELESQKKP